MGSFQPCLWTKSSISFQLDVSRQMARKDMHLDDGRDTFKTAGEYQTAGEYWRVRERKTVTIQRFWRGFSARRYCVGLVPLQYCDIKYHVPYVQFRCCTHSALKSIVLQRVSSVQGLTHKPVDQENVHTLAPACSLYQLSVP